MRALFNFRLEINNGKLGCSAEKTFFEKLNSYELKNRTYKERLSRLTDTFIV